MTDYFDVGGHTRPITTTSAEAQTWFDRGLVWVYGFNHEEAVACFRRAALADPDCAMAYWGEAYAGGPFYNMPWDFFSEPELRETLAVCHAALDKAMARRAAAAPVERALIEALAARYQADGIVPAATLRAWDDAYADAMRGVHAAHPGDLDVVALLAEAMLQRTPWRLWNVALGRPAEGADTLEAIDVLEAGIRLAEERGAPPHPGILHMYVHATEMSPNPERALDAAHALRRVAPADTGHLNHMPAHIYMQCGLYTDSVAISEKAIAADYRFFAYAGLHNFYTTSCCHDFHLMMSAAMFLGRYQRALKAADAITTLLTRDVLATDKPHMASTLEGYYSMRMHVLVRFGKWRDIIAAPMPDDPDLYCVTTAMHHYAKGVAHAALGDIAPAETEQTRFAGAHARVSPKRLFFKNYAVDTLGVAREMLAGEIAYRKGNHDAAFAHLRQAAENDDNLHYSEPWVWMHPPRHALGALLLEQGRLDEAAAVYRADLGLDDTLQRCSRHPDNVWSLHGYVECLERLGRPDEAAALRPKLDRALAETDVPVAASCCCRTGAAAM